jgi:glutamate-1-semialdehyde 2,1-aminomutase
LSDVEDLESTFIHQYLPESAWVVANEKKLPIILHLFREAALSDPDNLQYINTMAKKYPDARLVLAHCGRAFASWTLMNSIHKLQDNGNIWFDLSAVCEFGTMAACILKNAGKRVLWGSDYNCSMLPGRAVSVGSWQNWLSGDDYVGPERALVATENLMAFYQTALLLDLDQTQVNDIFYNNAAKLFG